MVLFTTVPTPKLLWLTRWPAAYRCTTGSAFIAGCRETASRSAALPLPLPDAGAARRPLQDRLGQLAQEPRRHVEVGHPEKVPAEGVEEVQSPHRPGHADVAEATLLVDAAGLLDGAQVRQQALFHPHHEDDRELQPLDHVQRDQGQPRLALVEAVDIADQGGVLEELRQCLRAGHPRVLRGQALELE